MIWWIVVAAVVWCLLTLLKRKNRGVGIQLPLDEWKAKAHPLLFFRALSYLFHIVSIVFLSWAFIHFAVGSGPLDKYVTRGPATALPPSVANSRILFFVVDRSGSMAEPLPGEATISKMSAVKTGLDECIATVDERGGGTDLMGLMTFARAAKIEVPLSRDRQFLRQMISKTVPETVERLNGTAIGYAIFKAVTLIVACRSLANEERENGARAPLISNDIVLITDGLEEPNPADRSNPYRSMRTFPALTYAKENNVTVNYVNVDKNSYQQLSVEERSRLLRAVEATGGGYFEVTPHQSVSQVMAQITQSIQVQKPPITPENRLEAGFWLIVFALGAASLSRLLETACVRVVR